MLSGEVAKRYGHEGLPDDTIHIQLQGTAGQSAFAAFLVARHHLGPGRRQATTTSARACRAVASSCARTPKFRGWAVDNIIVGNTVLYGAIAGEAFSTASPASASRCVTLARSPWSRARGDHGCEYMTGGTVVVLGRPAAISQRACQGGIAYVYDPRMASFGANCNMAMVEAGAGAVQR